MIAEESDEIICELRSLSPEGAARAISKSGRAMELEVSIEEEREFEGRSVRFEANKSRGELYMSSLKLACGAGVNQAYSMAVCNCIPNADIKSVTIRKSTKARAVKLQCTTDFIDSMLGACLSNPRMVELFALDLPLSMRHIEMISLNTTIVGLGIHETPSVFYTEVVENVVKMTQLKCLYLMGNDMTFDGFEMITRGLTNLSILDVTANCINNYGNEFSRSSSITCLSIGHNDINHTGIRSLCRWGNLERLDISGIHEWDETVDESSRCEKDLSRNTTITTLVMWDNHLLRIGDIISGNTTITSLDITNLEVSEGDVQQLMTNTSITELVSEVTCPCTHPIYNEIRHRMETGKNGSELLTRMRLCVISNNLTLWKRWCDASNIMRFIFAMRKKAKNNSKRVCVEN